MIRPWWLSGLGGHALKSQIPSLNPTWGMYVYTILVLTYTLQKSPKNDKPILLNWKCQDLNPGPL